MRLQRQGPLECFPTVAAMLNDVNKDHVISEALAYMGETTDWQVLMGRDDACRQKACEFIRAKYLPFVPEQFLSLSMIDALNFAEEVQRLDIKPATCTGRGVMFWGSFSSRHITAYGDGVVYDPALEMPLYGLTQRRIRDLILEAVVPCSR